MSGLRCSLQFFDRDDSAVHKIYLTDDSDPAAYYTLTRTYRSANQGTTQHVAAASPERPWRPDRPVDVAGLRSQWDNPRDSHAFPAFLSQSGVTRLQALRLAAGMRAWPVAPFALRFVLESPRGTGLPIQIRVVNPGTLQSYAGPVHDARLVGDWYSVLNANFNLHVREAAVHSAWIVRRPTVAGAISGSVTSLGLFDTGGNAMACMRGQRKPGISEDLAWRRLVTALTPVAANGRPISNN